MTYEIDCYNYRWLEIFDYVEVEPEERIEDPFTTLGEAKIYKRSTGETINVFIEDYGMLLLCQNLVQIKMGDFS